MLRKLKHVTKELKDGFGPVSLRSVTVDDVRKIREGWKLAPITTQKRLEMLRSFFRFCVDNSYCLLRLTVAVKSVKFATVLKG
jgi:hypothetical protein